MTAGSEHEALVPAWDSVEEPMNAFGRKVLIVGHIQHAHVSVTQLGGRFEEQPRQRWVIDPLTSRNATNAENDSTDAWHRYDGEGTEDHPHREADIGERLAKAGHRGDGCLPVGDHLGSHARMPSRRSVGTRPEMTAFSVVDGVYAHNCQTRLIGVPATQPNDALGVFAAAATMTQEEESMSTARVVEPSRYALNFDPLLVHDRLYRLAPTLTTTSDRL